VREAIESRIDRGRWNRTAEQSEREREELRRKLEGMAARLG